MEQNATTIMNYSSKKCLSYHKWIRIQIEQHGTNKKLMKRCLKMNKI